MRTPRWWTQSPTGTRGTAPDDKSGLKEQPVGEHEAQAIDDLGGEHEACAET